MYIKSIIYVFFFGIFFLSQNGNAEPPLGLNSQAMVELSDSGVDKYLGEFTPVLSQDVGDGWVKHTFAPDGGNGPICIAGTPYSAFTKKGNPSKLLIMLQGGGACWQDFYFCNILSEDQEPPFPSTGIWDFDSRDNPLADHSIVYLPYCDGSLFSGDNDVVDGSFPFGPVRFHRGLRNLSAGMDLAKAIFPNARRVTIAGSSAGGAGASAWSPFLARFLYGNRVKLTVFNDAGSIVNNPLDVGANMARAIDWQFGQFFPASCTDCDPLGQPIELIKWRLDNDLTIRESVYQTDGDQVNRFFLQIPTQVFYRSLILTEYGRLNDAHPDRFKRFIVSGDDTHTAIQTQLFYTQDVDDVLLNEWQDDHLIPRPFWVDLVEDFMPIP